MIRSKRNRAFTHRLQRSLIFTTLGLLGHLREFLEQCIQVNHSYLHNLGRYLFNRRIQVAEQKLNNFNTILTCLLPRRWTSQAGQRFTLQGKKEASCFLSTSDKLQQVYFFFFLLNLLRTIRNPGPHVKEKHKNLERRSQTSLEAWGFRNDRAVSSLSFLLPHVTQVSPGEARNLEMPTDVDKKRHEKSPLCSQMSRKRTAQKDRKLQDIYLYIEANTTESCAAAEQTQSRRKRMPGRKALGVFTHPCSVFPSLNP